MKKFALKYSIWYLSIILIASVSVVAFASKKMINPLVNEDREKSDNLETMLENSEDFHDFYQHVRIHLIQDLIDQGFDKFAKTPYKPGTFTIHLSWVTLATPSENYPDFFLSKRVEGTDSLDEFLRTYFRQYKDILAHYFVYGEMPKQPLPPIILDQTQVNSWKNIFLFKELDDLQLLNYDVSSYRLRENKDAQYRRDNIYISYYNIWNVRILNPGEVFSFMDEIHYDKKNPGDNIRLASGFGQAGGVRSMYGWGICGWGFGIFGVLAVNQWVGILERHNHTTRYGNLYNNELNGKDVSAPGLDTSVFNFGGSKKDFRVVNNRNYPIVLVMNYDRTYGWIEEIFSLWRIKDRWTFAYLGKQWRCYVWNFNGEDFKSCYSELR